MATFAAFALEPLSPLHLGSRRAGVVAQTHRHAPGHLFTHALAAAVGMRRGTTPAVFQQALAEVIRRFRFGPAFFMEGDHRLDDAAVERRLIASSHHVTLDGTSRSAVEGAMFEVESIQPARAIRLAGGVWLEDSDQIDGRPLADWLSDLRLGGELKTGFGRVRCVEWRPQADAYPGVGAATAAGVRIAAGQRLPGAALAGVAESPLLPWLGRRFDPQLGFGRRLSRAALVRMHGVALAETLFRPAGEGEGIGCWMPADA